MSETINKCLKCNIYSMEDNCPNCKGKISEHKAPKYSVEDNVGKYRRVAKKEILKEKGLY